jgi:hypothetical protein
MAKEVPRVSKLINLVPEVYIWKISSQALKILKIIQVWSLGDIYGEWLKRSLEFRKLQHWSLIFYILNNCTKNLNRILKSNPLLILIQSNSTSYALPWPKHPKPTPIVNRIHPQPFLHLPGQIRITQGQTPP